MDNYELRTLAGLSTAGIVREAKAAPKVEVDPSIFTKKSKGIVSGLLKCCELNAAIKKVKTQLKADDVENKEQLEKALEALKAMKLHEDLNTARRQAGLPLLEKKAEEDEEEEDDAGADDAGADDAEKGAKGEEEEEDDVPTIVKKMAAKLLKSGMPDEEKLADLLLKVYTAGHTDGMKEAEAVKDAE